MSDSNYIRITLPFLPIVEKVLGQLRVHPGTTAAQERNRDTAHGISISLDTFCDDDLESTRLFCSEMTEILSEEISSRLLQVGVLLEPLRPSSGQDITLSIVVKTDAEAETKSGGTVVPSTLSDELLSHLFAAVNAGSGRTKESQNVTPHGENDDPQPTRRSERLIARKSLLPNKKVDEESKICADAVDTDVEVAMNTEGTVEPPAPAEPSSLPVSANIANMEADTGPRRTREPQNAGPREENADLRPKRHSKRLTARKSLLANKRMDEDSKLGADANPVTVSTIPGKAKGKATKATNPKKK